jgi:PAS domain S-box-containing protein
MKFFQNLSIAIKVLIPPAVLILALVAVSLSALYGLNFQREALSKINDIALDRITLVEEFIALSEQVQADVFHISALRFMDLPEEEIQPIQERIERGLSDLNVIYGQILREWSPDEAERVIIERMAGPLDTFRQQARQAVDVASDNPSSGVVLVRAATVPFAELRGTLAEFLDYQQAKIVRAEAEVARRAMAVSTVILALALGITLVSIVATVVISNRLIAQPIRTMTDLMGRLADGDLSVQVSDLERLDEIGGMAQAVEIFRRNALDKAQVEEALRESEARLIAAQHIAKTGDFTWDVETGEVTWSDALFDLLRYDKPDKIDYARVNAEIHHPDDLERVTQWLNDGIASGETELTPNEYRIIRKDGEIIYVRTVGVIEREEGKPTRVFATVQDITGRKQAEEALRESERMLNATGKMGKIGGWEHNLVTGKAIWTQALYDIVEIPHDQEHPAPTNTSATIPPGTGRFLSRHTAGPSETAQPLTLSYRSTPPIGNSSGAGPKASRCMRTANAWRCVASSRTSPSASGQKRHWRNTRTNLRNWSRSAPGSFRKPRSG